jgi:hypothetical protein
MTRRVVVARGIVAAAVVVLLLATRSACILSAASSSSSAATDLPSSFCVLAGSTAVRRALLALCIVVIISATPSPPPPPVSKLDNQDADENADDAPVNVAILGTGEEIRAALRTDDKTHLRGADYDYMRTCVIGDGVLTTSGERWQAGRAAVATAFTPVSLAGSTALFAQHTLQQVTRAVRDGTVSRQASGDDGVVVDFELVAMRAFVAASLEWLLATQVNDNDDDDNDNDEENKDESGDNTPKRLVISAAALDQLVADIDGLVVETDDDDEDDGGSVEKRACRARLYAHIDRALDVSPAVATTPLLSALRGATALDQASK